MALDFDLEDIEPRKVYRTLLASVVPRPIGWISSRDTEGRANLAPFSFFNVACVDPPMIHISPGMYEDGLPKDTARNIQATGEFVHNMVTEETLHRMHCSSERVPTEESEFDTCGIEKAPSETVSPPRVRDSVASFECSLHSSLDLGSHTLIIGQIKHMMVDESILNLEGEIDINKLDAIGRLTAGKYVTIDSQFELESVKADSSTERDNGSDG